MRCHPSPRRYSDDLGRQPSDSGSSEIQSRDAPCGSVQPTGTPFTAIRKQPFGPSVAATLVIFHTAVLAHIRSLPEREEFARSVKTLCDSWISNESPRIFPKIAARAATEGPKGCFLMAGYVDSILKDAWCGHPLLVAQKCRTVEIIPTPAAGVGGRREPQRSQSPHSTIEDPALQC
jgi:hypothetical protein